MAYSKTTWTTAVTPISAANLNNLETQYDEAHAEIIAVSTASPSRASNTIYQNTSGKILLVTITVQLGSGEQCTVQVASSSPPGTTIATAQVYGTSTEMIPITFIVPPSYYYRLYSPDTIESMWREWTLH